VKGIKHFFFGDDTEDSEKGDDTEDSEKSKKSKDKKK
jgi:hypothetical protein